MKLEPKSRDANFSKSVSLVCPSCHSGSLVRMETHATCSACEATFAISDDIIDLRLSEADDPQLDELTYDEAHAVSDDNAVQLINLFKLCLLYTSPSPRDRG